jgi:hypothetical protein
MSGGGGGGPTTTTVNQSNIPEYLRPQVETLLGGATQQLFNTQRNEDGTYNITGTRPFTPYSVRPSDYVAGFSPLQQQVQANAANLQMPGQFNQATGYANAAGLGGFDSAGRAYGYGNAGFQSGQQAANVGQLGLRAEQYGRNVSNQAEDYGRQAANTGNMYEQMATNPSAYQAYMSPYQEAVTDIQLQGLQRQADIAATGRQANAVRAGAFGGSRQAIENAEANRALASQMDAVRAQGLQQSYQQAQANINQRAQLGLQGLQGAQQGLGTALQGGQLGLAGLGTTLQGLQSGMQGAQVGLQGLSGAQAGYGLANQAANQLGQLGTQQLAAQTGVLGLQNQIGGQQQAQQQQLINQAIQNYAQAQEAPMNAFNQYNALLRGYAIPGQTATQYQAQPSIASQVAGLGTTGIAGLGLYNAMNRGG